MSERLLKIAYKMRRRSVYFMGSKWECGDVETIAEQTIRACAANHIDHGDAFSWASNNLTNPRSKGPLSVLLKDGSLVLEPYEGDVKPRDTTLFEDGKPMVLRVTEALLDYAEDYR